MFYVSALHDSQLNLNVDRGKLYDFKYLFEEAIDLWDKDQKAWGDLVTRIFTETERFNRLYLVTWDTNYGERVALVYADGEDEVRALIEEEAWPDYVVEQLTMPYESKVLFVKGGGE